MSWKLQRVKNVWSRVLAVHNEVENWPRTRLGESARCQGQAEKAPHHHLHFVRGYAVNKKSR